MVVGPTLGTGLFIGSSQALAVGGPASLLISYVFLSVLVYGITTAVAEVAAHMPVRDGTMVTHTYRYASPHLGFALGYIRWCSLAMMVPFEITNAMVNIGLWEPGTTLMLRAGIVTTIISGFNMLPEKVFKRSERFFTGVKLFTTIALIIVSIVLMIPTVPGPPVRGFNYWRVPGPMNEYIVTGPMGMALGLLQCLLYSAISFILTPELIVQRAEQYDHDTTPDVLAVSRINTIHHSVLYVLSVVAMSTASPSNEPLLTNYGTGAGLSPYIVGIRRANVRVLRIIATILIFISSVASGRTFLFIASRTLCSLAENGHAPATFTRRTSWGVPYLSVMASALFAGVAFFSVVESSSFVYNIIMHFITATGYISWLCWCMVYFSFRRKTKEEGFTRVHQTKIQPYGAYFGLVVCTLLSIANALIIVVPAQIPTVTAVPIFVAMGMFVLLYLGHVVYSAIARVKEKFKGSHVERGHKLPEYGQRAWTW